MKKFLAFCMAVVILVTLATGCSKEKNDNPVLVLNIKSERFGIEGIIEIEMYPDKAPNTVKNIIYLANLGFYDGIQICQVRPDKLVEIGDPKNVQLGGVRYAIKGEFKENGFTQNDIKFERGVVAMSRYAASYDSAVGDFFIQLDDTEEYDGKFVAFGRVTKGLELLDEISRVKNVGRALGYEPVYPIFIESVYLKLKGKQYGEPKRLTREFFGANKGW